MKIIELWQDSFPPPPDPSKPFTNTVWNCCFSPDGSFLIAAVGNVLLVYNAGTGQLVKEPIKTKHEADIYCLAFAKDGKKFATGGGDKTVIIWDHTLDPIKKYTQNDSIQCMAFNPITGNLFSASSADWLVWSQDSTEMVKEKSNSKITCCSWTTDGQAIAFGSQNGIVQIRNKKLKDISKIQRKAAVWCVEWTPITTEHSESHLVVGSWDQTIAIYDMDGKLIGNEKKLTFDPLSLNFFSNGEFFIVSGNNNKVQMFTRELQYIGDICERESWIWNAKIKPKQMLIASCTQDGQLSMHEITFMVVHGLFKERYVHRHMLTDVIIQHLMTEQKIRIKCKELVKKVSIFKDRMAVQLTDKFLVYTVNPEDNNDIRYKIHKKIGRKIDCSLMVVVSNHILLCQDDKVAAMNFRGDIEREWVFEAQVRYMRPFGGAMGREGLLVGLKNGDAMELFVDNPFPVTLVKQGVAIRIMDLSLNKKKLAIVDENSNLNIYDLATKQSIFQEMNVVSVSWNSEVDDLLSYSGAGLLSIKMGDFPSTTQKMNGFIVGFQGSKLFYMVQHMMMTMDIPQGASLAKFIENRDFESAYKVACMGITEQDFKYLGLEALQAGDFDVASKCFLRIKEMPYIELLNKYEREKKLSGSIDKVQLEAEVLAYQNRYDEAAAIFEKNNKIDKIVDLYMEIGEFEKARKWAQRTGQDVSGINFKQAKIAMEVGNWETAANIYLQAKQYDKAIELYGTNGKVDKLIDICRMLDKNENEESIRQCAYYFKKHQSHQFAKEAYLKLGDMKSLMISNIELEKFDEAFTLMKTNPEFEKLIHQPYAEWLEKNDRFEEAQKHFKLAKKPELSMRILEKLSKNCIIQQKFSDAGSFFFNLSIENLKLIKNMKQPDYEDRQRIDRYNEFSLLADLYQAYQSVHNFIEEPFQHTGRVYQKRVFNSCRFMLGKLGARSPLGISKIYLYYALAKISKSLEAFQTARVAYEKLSTLKIPNDWLSEIEIGNLMVRSKPFSDKENLVPICNRCIHDNQIIIQDEVCTTCYHKFVRSSISYEILPLVEFQLDKNLNHKKFLEHLSSKEKERRSPNKRGGQQMNKQEDEENTPFMNRVSEVCDMQLTQSDYIPVTVNENIVTTMKFEEVYIVDMTKYCKTAEIKYYKNMLPEEPLQLCKHCQRFFLLDEYELAILEDSKCPFCKMELNLDRGDL